MATRGAEIGFAPIQGMYRLVASTCLMRRSSRVGPDRPNPAQLYRHTQPADRGGLCDRHRDGNATCCNTITYANRVFPAEEILEFTSTPNGESGSHVTYRSTVISAGCHRVSLAVRPT